MDVSNRQLDTCGYRARKRSELERFGMYHYVNSL